MQISNKLRFETTSYKIAIINNFVPSSGYPSFPTRKTYGLDDN